MTQVAELENLGVTDLAKLGVPVANPWQVPTFGVENKVFEVSFSDACRCNVPDDELLRQIGSNIRLGLPQVRPHDVHPASALLVCGGPSLAMTKKDLVDAHFRGGKIIAVNGAFSWCIKNNLRPSAVICLDAREFNARFVEPDVPQCKYFLAAQMHPNAFEMCRGRDIWIWHALSAMEQEVDLLKEYYRGYFWPVSNGTTVGIRAISLLQMLGFYSIEIFGLDSCWFDSRHHAYMQTENDADDIHITWLRPEGRDDLARPFSCSPWMMKQAVDFQELIRDKGDLFRLKVHGPGLLATMLETGAQLDPPEPSKGD